MPRRLCSSCVCFFAVIVFGTVGSELSAQTPAPEYPFLTFIQTEAERLRAGDEPPASREEWEERRRLLRQRLLASWGGFPEQPCDLAPQVLGTIEREQYRVEKIIFQTRPGIWMTANAYVPAKEGKLPAVLCVHGHWSGAKQDPVVQRRCIGLAKLGFFVLVVDAYGAGERAVGEALGEYHGEMTGATLLPVGLMLSGLQVYENQRAVDYLATRPEVDASRIGITGASGGGNQSMYAGAWDERFKAVTPVCSVGNFGAYLGIACCMCEMVPGALRFTEEGDVLGMTVPRGLLVISATKDAPQFSVEAARKSVTRVKQIADLYGASSLRHTIVEAPHDYNREMREAMYGWMSRYLREEGDGSPVAEPDIATEDPEALRCYPGDSRPDDYVTIPRFAAARGRELLAARRAPVDRESALRERRATLRVLEEDVLGGRGRDAELEVDFGPDKDGGQRFRFTSEPGIRLQAQLKKGTDATPRLALLLDLDGAESARGSELATDLQIAGWTLVTPELRATGQFAYPQDKIGHAPDHNTAEWAMWIGRPLLGQWVVDVRRTLDAVAELQGELPQEIAVIGRGPAGIVALGAASLDERITRVAAVDSLASYITEEPYRGQRVGIMAPGIVRDVGDVSHLAALVAPRPVVIAGGVTGGGQALDHAALTESYAPARAAYALENADGAFKIVSVAETVRALEP